jgi:hypothetical protein
MNSAAPRARWLRPRSIAELDLTETLPRALRIVRAYYAVLFVLSLLEGFGLLGRTLSAGGALWPVAWATHLGVAAVVFIRVLFIGGAFAAMVKPEQRWTRLLAFVGCLEFNAFTNSFGKINHSFHLWVVSAFLLLFLPKASRDRRTSGHEYLTVVWYCQAFVLLTYSMAGVAKLVQAVGQWRAGDRYWLLTPEALPAHVASHFIDMDHGTAAGMVVITHPWLGCAFFLSAVCLELGAFAVSFVPRLHRIWAVGLILLHAGILSVMALNFYPAMLLLAVLIFGSPFAAPLVQARAERRRFLPRLFSPLDLGR